MTTASIGYPANGTVPFRVRESCRLCLHERSLVKVLELPPTPLANEFPREPGKTQEEFPLWLALCQACGHVQLPVVVDPERLFRDYVYVSGTSPVFVDHFRRYAESFRDVLKPGDLVVEIGSNDGTLLRFFKEMGCRVVGVDPAEAIAAKATEEGILTLPRFFDEATATEISLRHGLAKLVIANNVFAHADDLDGIVAGVNRVLAAEGAFVFEVSYLGDVVAKTLFDTIYHEHLSYHSVVPLISFLGRNGLKVVDVQRVDTHGGSIRVEAIRRSTAIEFDIRAMPSVKDMWREERQNGLASPGTYAFLHRTILERRDELLRILRGARMAGKRIAAYGAPAKATTLARTFGIEDVLDFVVDDSPLKQGRWLPGGNVPVLPSSALAERRPDYVVILAWNFAESILEKLAGYRAAGGKCVVPLPKVRIID